MARDQDRSDHFASLRRQAEEIIRQRPAEETQNHLDLLEALQELNIHQVELEVQNEELQRSQQDLARLQSEYQDLYNFAPSAYLTINNKGIITRANLTAVSLLKVVKKHLLGLSFTSFLDRYFDSQYVAARKKASELGAKQSIELPLKRKNEQPIWVRADIVADKDQDGAVLQWRMVLVDINDLKLAERALKNSHERLEKLVAERTAELAKANEELESRVRDRTFELQQTYEQLLHAEKMSSIGKLSASIAHEFNNPLQGVTGIIYGIKKRANIEQHHAELLDLAIKECNRMRDLIKSLQDFTRPTATRKALVDLHAALESIILLSKKEYARRQVSIHKKYAENLPQIVAVADQLKQVFLNLLNNASEACTEGGTVTIETEACNSNVVIRIHDTGCGITPEDEERLFEPFFTTKAGMKGTGLGLSVSYGIIKAHGGEITVDSEPGRGSTFTVVLPVDGGPDGGE